MKYMFVDGPFLFARSYFSLLNEPERGQHFAVYEFINRLTHLMGEFKPKAMCVAFDGRNLIRKEQYPTYKSQRKPKPDDYYPQMNLLEDLLVYLDVHTERHDKYEADDVLYSLRDKTTGADEVVVVSGDKDLLQLVSHTTSVYLMRHSARDGDISELVRDDDDVRRITGVRIKQLADLKALAGDKSDNLPSVDRVSDVIAARLLRKFGTIENLYEERNIATLITIKGLPTQVQLNLRSAQKRVYEARRLIELWYVPDVELPKDTPTTFYIHNRMSQLNRSHEYMGLKEDA